jgi:hypothetical protein
LRQTRNFLELIVTHFTSLNSPHLVLLNCPESKSKSKSKSKFCYDWLFSRQVRLGIKHPSGAYDQIFISVWQLRVCWCGALSLTRERVCRLPNLLSSNKSLVSMYNLHVTSNYMYVYTTYTRTVSSHAQYSRSCPIISRSCYNSSLVTWWVVCLTTAKIKPVIFSFSRFALSNVANIYCPESKSRSHCDWRSVNQYVLVSIPIWGSWQDMYYSLTAMVLFLWGALSEERTNLFLYMLLALTSVVSIESESLGTRDYILLC